MLDKLTTEKRNESTMKLDQLTTKEVLQLMNKEDRTVPDAVEAALPEIEAAVEQVIATFQAGGRLIYTGAGTSGRLGILDAVECPPTFSTPHDMVQGLLAGGMSAFRKAKEGAEDNPELGAKELQDIGLTAKDTVIGIAASGRTPYVIGALDYAAALGAATVSVACNKEAAISKHAKISIEVETGPEILTGSTRLKAGTAQKLVLNMISTASMVGVGKVYKNLMVDVKPTNDKLQERAKRIIMEATGANYDAAEKVFNQADGQVKTAIVMLLLDVTKEEAEEKLRNAEGFVRSAIKA
ncbi:N-acetylmuramic acid 6-phosphate etherase [Terribacillus saccharophilus]|uniref:N-acetylmuramic acid 6-phosphate etherase n=1 Tax=Terribacillus saccharophilus TaxID=361277 RepID=A0ABX4GZI9_9BACI|nr:N-acetylmuramic acid 6-phosphate etherase [Terribacillus saccharophilus]PAD36197.1 N-acetylmuramic acid 6-phosphate etherase [Terribacillus saccharophilus]PAD96722.1 N-acetylmuramic acid 6-phosphate etherase [Terribacillus saccharophilus]PAE00298.1 N-acetylmuramic acid 6-phosphate etherase [Terribacillus saccharophilus]